MIYDDLNLFEHMRSWFTTDNICHCKSIIVSFQLIDLFLIVGLWDLLLEFIMITVASDNRSELNLGLQL